MKKELLYFFTFLFFATFSYAGIKQPLVVSNLSTYNGKSFTLVEQNVTFSVFPNGEFDFYINPYGNNVQANMNLNGFSISYNSGYNYDGYVQYDDFGAIIQIENVPVYYDYYGRVSTIGAIRINYNNYGRINRLGGLNIYYNNYGYYSHYSGYINNYNRWYVYHPYHNYFVQPLMDFRIVSYQPYRMHYKPYRNTYFKKHTYFAHHKNNYDSNYKYNRRSSIAKSNVPDRVENNAVVTRRNISSERNYTKNSKGTTSQRQENSTRSNAVAYRYSNSGNKRSPINSNNSVNNRIAQTTNNNSQNIVSRSQTKKPNSQNTVNQSYKARSKENVKEAPQNRRSLKNANKNYSNKEVAQSKMVKSNNRKRD